MPYRSHATGIAFPGSSPCPGRRARSAATPLLPSASPTVLPYRLPMAPGRRWFLHPAVVRYRGAGSSRLVGLHHPVRLQCPGDRGGVVRRQPHQRAGHRSERGCQRGFPAGVARHQHHHRQRRAGRRHRTRYGTDATGGFTFPSGFTTPVDLASGGGVSRQAFGTKVVATPSNTGTVTVTVADSGNQTAGYLLALRPGGGGGG